MVICMTINWAAWSAISSLGTFIVAIVAAIIVFCQYKGESKRVKEATRSKILADYN